MSYMYMPNTNSEDIIRVELEDLTWYFLCISVCLQRGNALAVILVACDGEFNKFPNKHSGNNHFL